MKAIRWFFGLDVADDYGFSFLTRVGLVLSGAVSVVFILFGVGALLMGKLSGLAPLILGIFAPRLTALVNSSTRF